MARTVMVADDSPTIQTKAKGILTGEGLEVVTVSNGVAAIKKLPTVKPLLILADVSMPGKDGYEVCEFVKNSPEFSHVPVILVFSDMEPYDENRGRRVGADATVRKRSGVRDPFDHDELISTVKRLLAQAEMAAPKVQAAPAPPPPTFVTEPVDVEPEISTRPIEPDLAALEEGVAFTTAFSEEPAAVAPPSEGVWEAVPAVEVPVSEMPLAIEEAPLSTEPVLVEDVIPLPAEAAAPAAEEAMVFYAPAEIAEPVLSDEVAPAALAEEMPPVPTPEEVAPPLAPEAVWPPAAPEEALPPVAIPPPAPEAGPVAATSLESFSLTEATTGHVRFVQEEIAEAAPPPEVPPPAPEAPPEAAALPEVSAPPPAPPLDPDLVYAIVHKVVVRMSPPALAAETVEEMARKLAAEVMAELGSEPSRLP